MGSNEYITSRHNPAIAEAVKLLADKGYRKEKGLLAAEGIKLLADAVECGAEITCVIVSESLSEVLPAVGQARLMTVPGKLFESISTQKSPQGTLFFCKRPPVPEQLKMDRYIVLDSVQDPGNVGTVIRTAAALGIAGVILCGASADPYSPKTVRATMGAIFKIPIFEMTYAQLHAECGKAGIRVLAAMPAGDATDIRNLGSEPIAAAIGSEGSGISDELLSICDGKMTIPMAKGTESLNAAAAAAIILWELSKNHL